MGGAGAGALRRGPCHLPGYRRALLGGIANRYYAEGRFGQCIYVVPDRELILVRTGRTDGEVDWVSVFERTVRRVDAVDEGSWRSAEAGRRRG